MFIDYAKIYIKSGKGGDGCVSFHREKFVPKGGPDGGDGGDGGDVIFIGDPNVSTLYQFRHSPKIVAQSGEPGKGRFCSGKSGKDAKVRVPCGTLIKNAESDELIGEILKPGERFIAAKGGNGGRGNARFATSTDQAPRHFEPGKPGVEYEAVLELKVMADVGLVGFPNAGKSSLITAVSHAKPKIGNYPFTTLFPNLGVIHLPEFRSIVMADIPGIIEGASHGKGLGIQFLKHVERTRVILFVIDISEYSVPEPISALKKLKKEIYEFGHGIPEKRTLIAANKMDLDPEEKGLKSFLSNLSEEDRLKVFPISSATKQGLSELIKALDRLLTTDYGFDL